MFFAQKKVAIKATFKEAYRKRLELLSFGFGDRCFNIKLPIQKYKQNHFIFL